MRSKKHLEFFSKKSTAAAGYLTGLLAQAEWRKDPLLAARFAVWQHGAAADYLSNTTLNWTLDELEKTIGSISAGGHLSPHNHNLNRNPLL